MYDLSLALTESIENESLGAALAIVSSLSQYSCPMLVLVNNATQITHSFLKVCMILDNNSTLTMKRRR